MKPIVNRAHNINKLRIFASRLSRPTVKDAREECQSNWHHGEDARWLHLAHLAQDASIGIVTSSQLELRLPTTANAEEWDFNDTACSSIAEIRLASPNVTTPL
jgi:hypothetical protein